MVPAGETLQLSYHNHSVDYLADVWMMYGGGYLELAKGGTWNETLSAKLAAESSLHAVPHASSLSRLKSATSTSSRSASRFEPVPRFFASEQR